MTDPGQSDHYSIGDRYLYVPHAQGWVVTDVRRDGELVLEPTTKPVLQPDGTYRGEVFTLAGIWELPAPDWQQTAGLR
jgi:hypothetical protein